MDEQYRQGFLEESGELFAELETALLELEQSPDDGEVVGRVFRAMHTIKGTGSMFGYQKLAEYTHELETVYDQIRNGAAPVTGELIDLTLRAVDYVKDQLSKPDDAQFLDQGAGRELISLLKKQIVATTESLSVPLLAAGSVDLAQFLPLLTEHELSRLRANLSKGRQIYCSSVVIAFVDLDRELADLTGRFKGEGELLSKIPYQEGIADGSIGMRLLFASSREPAQLAALAGSCPESVDCLDFFNATPAGILSFPEVGSENGDGYKRVGEILVERGEMTPGGVIAVLARQKSFGKLAVEAGLVSADQVESALVAQQRVKVARDRQVAEGSSSIRVPAERLDQLINLVGELVTVQARLSQLAMDGEELQFAELEAVAEEVERLTASLRDNALNIRMLPIGSAFNKFRRLVHDLAAELGKEIEMTTAGEETELDKTVIEKLNDPLVHLIRNSIDHGIEPSELREAAGKPRQGTVHLAAVHAGDGVLITIADDGCGLDREAIRAKALELGLIQDNAQLPDKELLRLIFVPGFSTATRITGVSGRGVGMDVVKRAIDALRGTIEIASRPGAGTTITIRIPLTLAIIESLLVQVGDDRFVIPLDMVNECVDLTRQDVADAHGRAMTKVRGHMIPYIPLREKFAMAGDPPEIQQIVITTVEGARVGFVVDKVIGEHQAVIKSLGRAYHDIQGVSGATILGSGAVALILDIPQLVRSSAAEDAAFL